MVILLKKFAEVCDMTSPKIMMFFEGNLFPTDMGNKRLILDIMYYLKQHISCYLNVCLACGLINDKDELSKRCDSVSGISSKWFYFLKYLNAPLARSGMPMYSVLLKALLLRRRFKSEMRDADVILLNYAHWHWLVPDKYKAKTVIITHDIQFFREDSFCPTKNFFCRWRLKRAEKSEIGILKKFPKIVVLGNYEKEILIKHGIESEKITVIGMPIQKLVAPPKTSNEIYDFALLGGASLQNIMTLKLFIHRVANKLSRRISIAVAGRLSDTAEAKELSLKNPDIIRLGFLENPNDLFAKSKLMIGTIDAGSGIKVKVVESMLNEKCVVATSKGLEGIPFDNTSVINIDLMPEKKYLDLVERMLDSESERRAYGRRAAELITKEFNPDTNLSRFIEECVVALAKGKQA